jgi:hypothetical protein
MPQLIHLSRTNAAAALGLLMVGTLNVISIAFAPLFVGVGVDFGIQFSVRRPKTCANNYPNRSPSLLA